MMKTWKEKKVLLVQIVASLIVMLSCLSEAQSQLFSRTYGGNRTDRAYSIQQTSDGGFVVVGETTSYSFGEADLWVLKLTGDGGIEWQKSFGGSRWDRGYSVQQTKDGGYVVAGRFQNTVNRFDDDLWVLKLGADGEIDWQNTYGGTTGDEAHSIQQTSDGGYIVAGETNVVGWEKGDVWILKLKKDGSIEWQKSYGGDHDQQAESIRQTSDGGYIVAGATDSFGEGQGDIWVLKLKVDGTIEWQKTYGGARLDYAYSIQQTKDGGYIVAGESASFDPRPSGAFEGSCGFLDTGCFDAWILKLARDGSIEWQKSYGGAASDGANSIQQTNDGGYVVTGQTSSFGAGWNAWAFKLDKGGLLEWQKTYSGKWANSIQQMSDGNYVLVGTTSSFGAGYDDAFLLKVDNTGDIYKCPMIGLSNAISTNTTVVGKNTNVEGKNTTIVPIVNTISVQKSFADSREICLYTGIIFPPSLWDWQDWSDRVIDCVPKPISGVLLPRCVPPICPDCLFRLSMYAAERKVPDYLPNIYREILFFLVLPESHYKYSESSINQIEGIFIKAQAGLNYNKVLKKEVLKSIEQIKLAKKVEPIVLGKLIEATSAIELDLSIPSILIKKANAGKYSKIDLDGVAWLAIKDLKKAGTVTLKVKNGFPAALPGFKSPWPIFTYDFKGTLLETGYLDINFFVGGINLIGKLEDIRIFEWDGKAYKDITINVDTDRKVVTGRTNRLTEYVVVTPNPGVESVKPKFKK